MNKKKIFSLFILLLSIFPQLFAVLPQVSENGLSLSIKEDLHPQAKEELMLWNPFMIYSYHPAGNTIRWEEYNFKFYVPSELNIRTNKKGQLKADNGTLYLTVTKEKGGGSLSKMANKFFKKAKIKKAEHTANAPYNTGGLDGWKIIGSGVVKGTSVVYAFLTFKDPDSGRKYAAQVIYHMRNTSNTQQYVAMISEIIKSFGKIR